ncbi:hypothetical protein J7643_03345 [bacterium]|nr:hypothetical protein [bacterium]
MASSDKPQGFDVNKGIYTLLTPDEESYMIAQDKEGVPVALYFTSAEKADKYRQDVGKPEFKVLFLEGMEGVKELTEELVSCGVKEAFLDHTKRTRQPVVLDLATWIKRSP